LKEYIFVLNQSSISLAALVAISQEDSASDTNYLQRNNFLVDQLRLFYSG
jgi:hypothetical protein